MKLSRNLRKLRRGVKIVANLVKTPLAKPLTRSSPTQPPLTPKASRFVTFDGFGDNPGRLRMLAHVPPRVTGRPLVVLLHGCGQEAARFALDSGWTDMADRLRFPLILPEQSDANNARRCFQWFQPSDTARGQGEAASIAEMTRAAINRFGSDPKRVFIVGLSAGGAMATAMLAAYPDLFAAGASVAGLPVGAARSGMQAILRMASAGPDQSPRQWADQVRAAAPHGYAGPWPRLSIWHGQSDTTVAPENANLLASQWRALHGLFDQTLAEQVRDGVWHRSWPAEPNGVVEAWSLPRFPHAYPTGARPVAPRRYVEQSPVDATERIARFFMLD